MGRLSRRYGAGKILRDALEKGPAVIAAERRLEQALGVRHHPDDAPCLVRDARDVVPPNVAAVTGDPVFFIGPEGFGFTDVAVAGHAVHVSHLDMRHVGEVDTVGLPCVDEPWDFTAFEDVFVVEFFLVGRFPQDLLVTLEAILERIFWLPG